MYSKHIGFSISTASRPASNIKNTSVFQYPVLRGRPRTLKTYSFSQYPAPRGRPRDLKTHWIFNIRCFEAGLKQQNILVFAISNVSRPASSIKNILVFQYPMHRGRTRRVKNTLVWHGSCGTDVRSWCAVEARGFPSNARLNASVSDLRVRRV